MNFLASIEEDLKDQGFDFERKELDRPWGGFWAIGQDYNNLFIKKYFPEYLSLIDNEVPMSPKILAVAPEKRLSWQYHNRRSELWKVIGGEVGVVKSSTDIENQPIRYREDQIVCLNQGERHRLIGLKEWGTVAEIWIHTDAANPSDENDIVRLQDDFGRLMK